jgi:nucleoid DNA-binding protein
MAKKNAAPTKSQVVAAVAAKTDLSKKQVSQVFEALGDQIKKSLKGGGVFTLPPRRRARASTPSPARR